MIGEVSIRIELGKIPSRRERMEAIHEGRVVAHLWWQRSEQVSNALLLLHVDVEIANHDDDAFGADIVLPRLNCPEGHVTLHDIHAIPLVE